MVGLLDNDLGVPGGEIIAGRQQSKDVNVALRDAFDAARLKLEDCGHHERQEIDNAHEPILTGRVTRLRAKEDCGFVADTNGQEYYFSAANALVSLLHPGEDDAR
jgi:hypothetical protein